jgi:hypothetical protein
MSVLDPKVVFAHHISRAKLAALPVDSQLLLANVFGYVGADLVDVVGNAAFLAGFEHMTGIALIEKVICEISKVNKAIAGLAVGQNSALGDVMIFLITLHALVAVCAFPILFFFLGLVVLVILLKHSDLPLLLELVHPHMLQRLLVHRLSAV